MIDNEVKFSTFEPQGKRQNIDSLKHKINNYLIPELQSDSDLLELKIEEINKNKLRITQLEIELNGLHRDNDNLQNGCAKLGNSIKIKEKKLSDLKASLVDAILQE